MPRNWVDMIRASLTLLLCIATSHLLSAAEQASPATYAIASGSRAQYAGDESCTRCHKDQATSWIHTSHHLTSQLADRHSVLGSFLDGSNLLMIVNPERNTVEPGLSFKMEARDGRLYQSAVAGSGSLLQTRTELIDLVTGSGNRGQTYLYWQGDRLYELPVSYWSDGNQWINSPGFNDGTAVFSRPINPGCLECHATYIKALSTDPLTNRYDRQSLVTGISCESCHGPGAAHVASPGAAAMPILNPAKFSRDRQVDLCALCHNGIQREETAPAFSYLPGQPLADYFKPLPIENLEHPDVHGNQVGLLQRSRCYISSPSMSCSTCHNVHAPEKKAASYSGQCLTCHQWKSCGVSKQLGHKITTNCIDCHMPVETTSAIVSETAGHTLRATMRNHWIKVYPDARMP